MFYRGDSEPIFSVSHTQITQECVQCRGANMTVEPRVSSGNVCVFSELVCQLMRWGLPSSLYNSAAHPLWSQFISPCAAANVNRHSPPPRLSCIGHLHWHTHIHAHRNVCRHASMATQRVSHSDPECRQISRCGQSLSHTHGSLCCFHHDSDSAGLPSPLTHQSHPAPWLQRVIPSHRGP